MFTRYLYASLEFARMAQLAMSLAHRLSPKGACNLLGEKAGSAIFVG